MDFQGRAVAVTGAGSGMGERIAHRFAEHGAAVAVVDIDADAAAATAETIEAETPAEAVAITADVSDADDVAGFIARTVEEFGSIDVLHNNAGIPQEATPVEEVTEATWDRIQDVNLKSAFLGAKYAVPRMREQGGGVILNTASTAGIRPRTGLSAYAASKGGMITLTKQLAFELADDDIRVNAICPVATDTGMLPQFAGDDLSVEGMAETIPLGRLAEPDDVADAAVFLASGNAQMITGTALEVDGGRDI
ncbi:SDR family oxidoreductase [Halobellus sp. Atlit-38R]|jgi:3-oxoacyl-[acyl-carrier protein] reductase|uniref:SDR family oxidoreductase n=1 Tax=Halobellus sp. Atlit-38R TaxID=2282131 RepID=UPI000EF25A91|nr:SDR family oxidoreductase [Halobellus sp. Atlit-38R]RLM90325.1 SDR family oxidoreductase [Halobellus sp. Atlit-38R]